MLAKEIDQAPGDQVHIPEARVRVADQPPAPGLGVAVHGVDLQAEDGAADDELGEQGHDVRPQWRDLQREMSHGDDADDHREAVQQVGQVQRLPEVE